MDNAIMCVQKPDLKPGMIVKHYKGKLYKILYPYCLDTETHGELVIYHEINRPERLYARPRSEFYDMCYINGIMKQRFVEHDILAKEEW